MRYGQFEERFRRNVGVGELAISGDDNDGKRERIEHGIRGVERHAERCAGEPNAR